MCRKCRARVAVNGPKAVKSRGNTDGAKGNMKLCKTEISDAGEQSEEVWRAVAARAFSVFENGGRKHGRDLEDWLTAEKQLLSFNADLRITGESGKIVIRAHLAVKAGIDLVVSVSKERILIFRAAEIDEHGDRDLLQVIVVPVPIEADRSEALLDDSELLLTCWCSRSGKSKSHLDEVSVQAAKQG